MIHNPFTGEVLNAYCPTGKGGGRKNTCPGKGRVSGKQQKVLDKLPDELMIQRTAEFHSTRERSEKQFGFALSPPKWVLVTELPGASSVVQSLVDRGILERESSSLGDRVRRAGVPQDYYRSSAE